MKVTLWGTRGSLPSPGPANIRYGGNTSCVEVRVVGDGIVVLDAGTGIYRLGASLSSGTTRVDLLLSHLHMDHIVGMGFFAALFRPEHDVHVWGPPSTTQNLEARIGRYLSPPLFPVRLKELPAQITFHDVPVGRFEVPGLEVTADMVCHPDPTVGYRLDDGSGVLVYLPDHEPALGNPGLDQPAWMSGFDLAESADVLIHDSQYTEAEYAQRVGWGHSSLSQALQFAATSGVRRFVPFHHDPGHDDTMLDRVWGEIRDSRSHAFEIIPAREGLTFSVGRPVPAPNRWGR